MTDRRVFEKSLDNDAKFKEDNEWLREEIFEKLKKRGFDPFIFLGFQGTGKKKPMRPAAMFWGGNVADFLMCIAESCEMLSKMYTKADGLDVLDAVKTVLEIRDRTQKTGIPPSEVEVEKAMDAALKKFGAIDHKNAKEVFDDNKSASQSNN